MRVTVKLDGFRELEAALAELPRATGMNVLRRVARGALKPMQDFAKGRAPKDTGQLAASITIKNTPDKIYNAAARKSFLQFGHARGVRRDRSTGISLTLAPTARRGTNLWKYAYFQEFGTVHMTAQPYMRPAWDAKKLDALDYVKSNLRTEIDKSAERLARKQAKAAKV